jgi:hypothetical protein
LLLWLGPFGCCLLTWCWCPWHSITCFTTKVPCTQHKHSRQTIKTLTGRYAETRNNKP